MWSRGRRSYDSELKKRRVDLLPLFRGKPRWPREQSIHGLTRRLLLVMIDFVTFDFKTRAASVFLLTAFLQSAVSCCCGHFPFFEDSHSRSNSLDSDEPETHGGHQAGHHCPHSRPGGHDETPCEKQSLSWIVGPDGRFDDLHAQNSCGAPVAALDSSSRFETSLWASAPSKPVRDRTRPHTPLDSTRLLTSRWLN